MKRGVIIFFIWIIAVSMIISPAMAAETVAIASVNEFVIVDKGKTSASIVAARFSWVGDLTSPATKGGELSSMPHDSWQR